VNINALRIFAATSAIVVGLASFMASSLAQEQRVRVRGVIEKVDGDTVMIKSVDGAELKLTLTANALIVGVNKATLADIGPGSFVGSTAMPQADGSQKAVEVHIFAESQRGAGEGHRPYTLPNSTMTNGTVGEMVTAADGGTLTVKYKDGEKKIVVPPSVPIVRYEIASRADLVPGVHITALNALRKGEGTFEAARLNVGRNGLVPQ